MLRHFQINLARCGYKSARTLNCSATVTVSEIQSADEYEINVFGPTRPVAYIEVTHLDNATAELFVTEMIEAGGTRADFMAHLTQLIREAVLWPDDRFNAPTVTEILGGL